MARKNSASAAVAIRTGVVTIAMVPNQSIGKVRFFGGDFKRTVLVTMIVLRLFDVPKIAMHGFLCCERTTLGPSHLSQ